MTCATALPIIRKALYVSSALVFAWVLQDPAGAYHWFGCAAALAALSCVVRFAESFVSE